LVRCTDHVFEQKRPEDGNDGAEHVQEEDRADVLWGSPEGEDCGKEEEHEEKRASSDDGLEHWTFLL
jgi:hypothetical protein